MRPALVLLAVNDGSGGIGNDDLGGKLDLIILATGTEHTGVVVGRVDNSPVAKNVSVDLDGGGIALDVLLGSGGVGGQ